MYFSFFLFHQQNSLSYQKEKDDSTKLKKLKRYLRQCGTRLNYQKFFSDCRSMKGKERKLETYIKELTDIEGVLTCLIVIVLYQLLPNSTNYQQTMLN